MNTGKTESEKTKAKEKLEVICRGVDESIRDINSWLCCSVAFNILRG